MSVFPKRTVRDSVVTVHCHVDFSGGPERPAVPLLLAQVRGPHGATATVLEEQVLVLPDADPPSEVGLRRDVPLAVLADLLAGSPERDRLLAGLERARRGRHWYVAVPVPADAPLGRYDVLVELHHDGRRRRSATAAGDFFLVEALSLERAAARRAGATALVRNHGPEPVPARVVSCTRQAGRVVTSDEVLELPPGLVTEVVLAAPVGFLFWSEDRRALRLDGEAPSLVRNQELDAAPPLGERERHLWDRADGLLTAADLSPDEQATASAMVASGLLRQLPFR